LYLAVLAQSVDEDRPFRARAPNHRMLRTPAHLVEPYFPVLNQFVRQS
jgi:hypothetical protein